MSVQPDEVPDQNDRRNHRQEMMAMMMLPTGVETLIGTMVHVGPVTQCREQGHMNQLQMPGTDVEADRRSGLRPKPGNDSTDLAVGKCMR